ncbi:hypothetical protein AB0H18_09155 [Streptomyces sp. NPDC020766]|uniref:hypothetical protein n=1 Tax=Streptomyces sp. NPDC020766 TaxID=3155011 RepID=UPI003401776E
MLDLTVRFLASMLSICTPRPRGRHRLGVIPLLRFTPAPPPRFRGVLRGRAAEHRRQRERRRALYLATLGIDIGPDRIHGVPVAAR